MEHFDFLIQLIHNVGDHRYCFYLTEDHHFTFKGSQRTAYIYLFDDSQIYYEYIYSPQKPRSYWRDLIKSKGIKLSTSLITYK